MLSTSITFPINNNLTGIDVVNMPAIVYLHYLKCLYREIFQANNQTLLYRCVAVHHIEVIRKVLKSETDHQGSNCLHKCMDQ